MRSGAKLGQFLRVFLPTLGYRVRYPVWQHTIVSPSAFSRKAVVSYWRKYVHKVLVNCIGGLSLPRKRVVRLTDRPDMTLDVYGGRKTTKQLPTLAELAAVIQVALLLENIYRRILIICNSEEPQQKYRIKTVPLNCLLTSLVWKLHRK